MNDSSDILNEILGINNTPEENIEDNLERQSNSILLSIKKMMGPESSDTVFDEDLIIHINSVFMILRQLGVCNGKSFYITGNSETWDDYFSGIEEKDIPSLVITYMYLKTKLVFDPPSTGVLHEAMERQISEFEWRLNVDGENNV